MMPAQVEMEQEDNLQYTLSIKVAPLELFNRNVQCISWIVDIS